jgi:hypothetical protein
MKIFKSLFKMQVSYHSKFSRFHKLIVIVPDRLSFTLSTTILA